MDFIKIALIGAIAVTVYYLLLQWPPVATSGDSSFISEVKEIDTIPHSNSIINDSKDSLSVLELSPSQSSDLTVGVSEVDSSFSKLFYLSNDVLNIGVDSLTGRFVSAEMEGVRSEKDSVELVSMFGNRLVSEAGEDCPQNLGALMLNSKCVGNYFASSGFYSVSDGYLNPNFSYLEEVDLDGGIKLYILSGQEGGLSFTKKILFRPGEYTLSVEDIVGLEEGMVSPKKITPYARVLRDGAGVGPGGTRFDNFTYLGPIFSTQNDTFDKKKFKDLSSSPFEEVSLGGWLALVQRYFVSAWVPQQDKTYKFQARQISSGAYSIALTGQDSILSVGEPASFQNKLYVGPKLTEQLNKTHPDLGLVVDYGFLWWLGQPIHKLMSWGYALLGNWGLAILFATLVLKAILWPLSAAGYRSAAKMRAAAPKIQELQQQYGSDKQKFGQEMMALYKKEGTSPLGGCLPMLLQMPFFLAFYWVLLDMVELRHAPFLFWITDLSSRDPLFILPVINAALMYYSQKFMPTTPSNDPTQQQMQAMMKYMPLMIAVMFAFFPSGFVLYFTVQSFITLVQQALSFRREGVSLKSV